MTTNILGCELSEGMDYLLYFKGPESGMAPTKNA